MLIHLRAQNLGLIRDAAIEPGPGLTVITGETGAGKTLLLGALRLLLGEQADQGIVGPFSDMTQADGLFEGESELGVSRIVPSSGRSRSYLDGKLASVDSLGAILGDMVQIVGQHDQLELKKPAHALRLIDSNLDRQGLDARSEYGGAWNKLQVLKEEQARLGGSGIELVRELDLVRYQSKEIAAAGFSEGDDDELDRQSLRLRNATEIREHLRQAIAVGDQLDELSGELVSHLRKMAELDTGSAELSGTSESIGFAISELNRDLAANVDSLVDDPDTFAGIEQRLNLLGDLKMKYGRTLEEVLGFGRSSASREAELVKLLDRSGTIDDEIAKAEAIVESMGSRLSDQRKTTARRIESDVAVHLSDLALGDATLELAFERIQTGANGVDRVKILFASQSNLQPGELTKVASGGELSRLVLALSLATNRTDGSTLVFDEVDAGVGGATALAMARKLADLARARQVLCVTHLPQVAAFAESHFVISRDDNEAVLAMCEGEDRLQELSRMIAGLPESDRGQQAAAELLELASA